MRDEFGIVCDGCAERRDPDNSKPTSVAPWGTWVSIEVAVPLEGLKEEPVILTGDFCGLKCATEKLEYIVQHPGSL